MDRQKDQSAIQPQQTQQQQSPVQARAKNETDQIETAKAPYVFQDWASF